MILTERYRPATFSDVFGQKSARSVLRGVLKDPSNAPRVMILYGEYGIGKTTLARLFARTLNCEKGKMTPCRRCGSCQIPINRAPFYQEYDCGMVGNVDTIREIKAQLLYTSTVVKWQVVVFDEFHMASKQAQGAFLKTLEELDGNTFVIFCTTDFDRIIDTIKSRSVNIPLIPLTLDEGRKLIDSIIQKEETSISDQAIQKILGTCSGHARDIVMQVDTYLRIGEEEFLAGFMEYEKIFLGMLYLIRVNKQEKFEEGLMKISSGLLMDLKRVFFSVLDNGMKTLLLHDTDSVYSKQYKSLCNVWRYDLIKLFEYSVSEWGNKAFEDDLMFQCFMRALFLRFRK